MKNPILKLLGCFFKKNQNIDNEKNEDKLI